MEKSPIREKEDKKKLSSLLPKALIEELNKNNVDKQQITNNIPSFPLKEKDINLNSNQNMTTILNGNHINHNNHADSMLNLLNNKNFSFTNGSYKNQKIPQFQVKGNGINANNLDGEQFFNKNNGFKINSKNNCIRYII